MEDIKELREKALKLEGVSDFGLSRRKGKRFYVLYNGVKINFGSSTGKTYIDHKDDKKRENWKKRHSQIKNNEGTPFYTIRTSPSYYSWHLLW